MKQICLQWQNMVDEKDCGLVIGSLPFFIGRADRNDVVLPTPGSGVSRRHARLANIAGDIVLTDLQSTNGTHIDGHRIAETASTSITPSISGFTASPLKNICTVKTTSANDSSLTITKPVPGAATSPPTP